MFKRLHKYRFEIFFFTTIIIVFSPGLVLNIAVGSILKQVSFVLNFLAGIVLLSNNKKLMRLFFLLVVITFSLLVYEYLSQKTVALLEYIKLACYFTFYIIVSYELIKQVVKSKFIGSNVIIGLMCGYICIGLVCFFAFITIEMIQPGSFHGIDMNMPMMEKKDYLLYFSYITLLTIGYGDILPATRLSQNFAVLTGLVGQFYMVILTAIIVGKFLIQKSNEDQSV